MLRLLEDNTVVCSDGSVINSGHAHKTGCAKSKALAEAFSYISDLPYTRESGAVEELSFDGMLIWITRKTVNVTGENGRIKLFEVTGESVSNVDPLETMESFSDRVKRFAEIVIDEKVKRDFIGSLPRVRLEVAGETKKVILPDKTRKMVVEGRITDIVVEKGREAMIPATQTFIQYKGGFYPEDWDGSPAT